MNKDSALGRALRVLGYQIVILVLAFLLDPNVVKGITEQFPQLATLFVIGTPILSGVYNLLRSDVPNV